MIVVYPLRGWKFPAPSHGDFPASQLLGVQLVFFGAGAPYQARGPCIHGNTGWWKPSFQSAMLGTSLFGPKDFTRLNKSWTIPAIPLRWAMVMDGYTSHAIITSYHTTYQVLQPIPIKPSFAYSSPIWTISTLEPPEMNVHLAARTIVMQTVLIKPPDKQLRKYAHTQTSNKQRLFQLLLLFVSFLLLRKYRKQPDTAVEGSQSSWQNKP